VSAPTTYLRSAGPSRVRGPRPLHLLRDDDARLTWCGKPAVAMRVVAEPSPIDEVCEVCRRQASTWRARKQRRAT
jgi:hypothetical protein